MSSKYSKEFKASIIARLLPPNNASVPGLSRETGGPRETLYMWRLQHRRTPQDTAAHGQRSPKYSSKEKLSTVIETASFSETELGEYCPWILPGVVTARCALDPDAQPARQ
ncbi:transposase [Geoalkalibacter subterraneus]|uniref:transposase n=1 Tax=Geoalkalibacter subterraneus TaxID=483547 RepID=UPI0006949403